MTQLSRPVFGRHFARQSNQPALRNKPWLDNQVFRISRGQQVPTRGMRRTGYVPLAGHWQPATCEELGCRFFTNGWVTTIDLTPQQDPAQLQERQYASRYLHQSGWDFRVEWDGSKEIFHFAAGQNHYAKIDRSHRHYLPVARDPVFVHLTGPRQGGRVGFDEFFDRFNENSYQLRRRTQDG